jgi:hypothetical protein
VKDIKRRIELFSFFDHTAIVVHLEKMARKGWRLERITNYLWVYRRTEPKDIHYAVSYYPKASEFDAEPSEEQKSFNELCRHTGWELTASAAQMQIFSNNHENPIPIDTDPYIELDNIHRSAKKNFLLIYALLLAISIMQLLLAFSSYRRDPISFLSSSTNLFAPFVQIMLFLLCCVEIVGYYVWRLRALKAAKRGEFLRTRGSKLQCVIMWITILSFVWWLVTLGMGGDRDRVMIIFVVVMLVGITAVILVVNVVKQTLKRRKSQTGITRTATIVTSFVLSFALMGLVIFVIFKAIVSGVITGGETYIHDGEEYTVYNDPLPLSLEDLSDGDYHEYSRWLQKDETMLLGRIEAYQRPRFGADNFITGPDLFYTVTVAKVPFLYDMCKDIIFEEYSIMLSSGSNAQADMAYDAIDAVPWGAIEAYQMVSRSTGSRTKYLLCYTDRIVEIDLSFNRELTPDQMATVGEKLKGI